MSDAAMCLTICRQHSIFHGVGILIVAMGSHIMCHIMTLSYSAEEHPWEKAMDIEKYLQSTEEEMEEDEEREGGTEEDAALGKSASKKHPHIGVQHSSPVHMRGQMWVFCAHVCIPSVHEAAALHCDQDSLKGVPLPEESGIQPNMQQQVILRNINPHSSRQVAPSLCQSMQRPSGIAAMRVHAPL